MYVSFPEKFCFFHNPRTGGTSFLKALRKEIQVPMQGGEHESMDYLYENFLRVVTFCLLITSLHLLEILGTDFIQLLNILQQVVQIFTIQEFLTYTYKCMMVILMNSCPIM